MGPWKSWGPWRCACWGPVDGQDGWGHILLSAGAALKLEAGGAARVQVWGGHCPLGTRLDFPILPLEGHCLVPGKQGTPVCCGMSQVAAVPASRWEP